jgi:hypothetical protein
MSILEHYDLPTLETQGGDAGWNVGARQLSAYRSLAASRNIPVERVLEAAAKDQLADIVELRDYGRERKIEARNLARVEHCYRLQLLGILQERYELLQRTR